MFPAYCEPCMQGCISCYHQDGICSVWCSGLCSREPGTSVCHIFSRFNSTRSHCNCTDTCMRCMYTISLLIVLIVANLDILKVQASSIHRQYFSEALVGAKLNNLQLLRDIDVRWSSTLLMIDRAICLKRVCEHINLCLTYIHLFYQGYQSVSWEGWARRAGEI